MSAGTQIAILGGLAAALVGLAVWIALRVHGTPEKRERRRRQAIHLQGRLAEALITDADEGMLYYSYSVGGVYYTASQDVSALGGLLPADRNRLLGLSNLKYYPRNPANSILLCEEWSGLRAGPAHGRSEETGAGPVLPDVDGVGHKAQDSAAHQ